MKALTIAQPWAQLLVLGVKQYETRTWRTSHRGPLLIHAGRKLTRSQSKLWEEEPLRTLLPGLGFARARDLPRGAILGTVEVLDCIDVDALFEDLSEQERALGDFRPGRWAWMVGERHLFEAPLPCRGHRGLFELEPQAPG